MAQATVTDPLPVRVDCHLGPNSQRSLPEDVLDGLTRPFKELPPKHFYDDRGSALFDAICDLPEYYPTRTERLILETWAAEIVGATGMRELVELGAGTAAKTRVLLDAMGPGRYIPFDVNEQLVTEVAGELATIYDGLEVHGVVGDFERHLSEVPRSQPPRVVAFLGGTIGNFTPGARRRFLRQISQLLGPSDFLLLGTDLVKDIDILEAAYDDSQGITAEFNRNVLHVLNRELGADFPIDRFEHVAFFDTRHEWIEMRLRAQRACDVKIPALGLEISFTRGEELRTEISAKFTRERVESDLAAAGLTLTDWLTDPDDLFALSLSRLAG